MNPCICRDFTAKRVKPVREKHYILLVGFEKKFSEVRISFEDGMTFVSLQGRADVLALTGEIELDAGDFIFS